MAEKPLPTSTPALRDAIWLKDLTPGQRTWVGVTLRGIPCMFTLEADTVSANDVGWVRIIGLAVGPQSLALTESDANERAASEGISVGAITSEPLADITGVLADLRTYALRELANWEDTRRFVRAVAGVTFTLPDRDSESGKWMSRLKHSERVELLALIQNEAKQAGIERPGPFVQAWMGISERTYFNLLRDAESHPRLKVERGAPGRPPNHTAAKVKQKKATTRTGKGRK